MTTPWQLVVLLGAHWVADFVLQTRWQAANKSKNNLALSEHVVVYTAIIMVAAAGLFSAWPSDWGVPEFAIVNGGLHWMTDYCTSRMSSHFYAKQDWHNFFVVIGFDQLIHQATLAATMVWIFG